MTQERRGTAIRVKLRWTVNGVQTGISKTFHRSPDRESLIAQYIEQTRFAKRERLVPSLTVTELVEKSDGHWLRGLAPTTEATYRSAWKNQVKPYFGNTEVTALTVRKVIAFARSIERDSTRINALAALSRICKEALMMGYLQVNPVSNAEAERRTERRVERPVIETDADWKKLITEVRKHSERVGDALTVGMHCALRIGEVSGLQSGDYDPATHLLKIERQVDSSHRVREPKWGSKRTVPVNPEAHEILMKYQRELTAGTPMFGSRGGYLSTSVLRRQVKWQETVASIGMEGLRVHDLRHTGLTRLVPTLTAAGLPINVVSKIAGHKDLQTTQRYLHTIDRDLTAAAAALWASESA